MFRRWSDEAPTCIDRGDFASEMFRGWGEVSISTLPISDTPHLPINIACPAIRFLRFRSMTEPIQPITLPPAQNPQQEARWLQTSLCQWLDQEFIPEPVNQKIAYRAAQVYLRQRMEGENDLGALVIAMLTEMQGFDFSQSFFSEFAIANAVSDLLLKSLGIDRCCGQS